MSKEEKAKPTEEVVEKESTTTNKTVFNFTKHNFIVEAENLEEATTALEEHLKKEEAK